MQLDLRGPAGRLEALLEAPEHPAFAAVVCHPHPLYGGTMHTHATYRLMKAVRAQGGAALRFNFRGVGRSAGTHDGGRGEAEDARAALRWLGERWPAIPRLACGFSFGAWMAIEAGAADPGARSILCGGLALSIREAALETARACPKAIAVVQAEHDEFGLPAAVEDALQPAPGPRRVWTVPGTTHLVTEDLPAFERAAGEALRWLREVAP